LRQNTETKYGVPQLERRLEDGSRDRTNKIDLVGERNGVKRKPLSDEVVT